MELAERELGPALDALLEASIITVVAQAGIPPGLRSFEKLGAVKALGYAREG